MLRQDLGQGMSNSLTEDAFQISDRLWLASLRLRSARFDPAERERAAAKNLDAPIHQLPEEILIRVFRESLVESHIRSTRSDAWTHVGECHLTLGNRVRAAAMMVCKYWHTLISGTPVLWSTIIVRGNIKWLKLSLSRSGSVPIDVRLSKRELLISALPILSSYSDRMRMLHFANLKEVDILPLKSFLSKSNFPQLEELGLHGMAFGGDVIAFSLDKECPSLHTLRLSNAFVSLDCPLISTLHALDLSSLGLHPNMEALSLDSFLAALEKCTSLQNLRFDWSLPYRWNGQSGRVLTLPNLRSLRIISPTLCEPANEEVLFTFLRHLRLPLDADIHITADLDDEREGYDFLRFVPQDAASLPILRHATSANCGRASFQCTAEGGGNIRVELDNPDLEDLESPHPQDELLEGFCALFSRAPLTKLAIASDTLSSEGLASAFHTFQSILELEFSILGRSNEAVDDLVAALSVTDTSVPLPRLRSLRVVGARGLLAGSEMARVKKLEELAKARAGCGVKLDELIIKEAAKQTPYSVLDVLAEDDVFLSDHSDSD
ncbi:hypothetical protein L226DRAFT_226668 [Lentinus tigrinus ALCF2SS1-7]|uniref:F-box domain-containing protein n=1 Tax=Lentinus tigrinus ALCF2SS1-6 TaxID=1328759 RepID=A0A5C2RRG5_9APHY|nr:hypothetical protein L227DRAFT_375560 [Lentinus tigrinus ALCF2SS1-6]RPD70612.1 hypothetical protein L226DRAFT_226668 [Lentinus tigrinus ALCF2SS1-7]